MIEVSNLSKIYKTKEGDVNALLDVNLHVEKSDIFGIIGMSGAGKSTLIRCIGLLEEPTTGNRSLEKSADNLAFEHPEEFCYGSAISIAHCRPMCPLYISQVLSGRMCPVAGLFCCRIPSKKVLTNRFVLL